MQQLRDLAFKAVRHYRKWSAGFKTEVVRREGLALPAAHLRLCGAEFHDDEYFLASARRETERLMRLGLTRESRVLDVGCGMGRLALGLLSKLGGVRSYRGMDVQADCVDWCNRHIRAEHPEFQFVHVNARNHRYNPGGEAVGGGFRFPFEDSAFDIINMFSVFTHLTQDHVEVYLSEFKRVLAPSGRIFLTAYVEDGVPEMTENPKGYLLTAAGPLHLVRYERTHFEKLVAGRGFKVDGFKHAAEPPGQSAYYLSHA